MPTFDDVFGAAESLAATDRIRLVHALWQTIPPAEWPGPTADWMAEVQRRSEELDAGRMSVSTWDEVRQRARREAGLNG